MHFLFGDINVTHELVVPFLVTVITGWLISKYNLVRRFAGSKFARKRAEQEFKFARLIIMSDVAGGVTPYLLMQINHLVVRCTVFLAALVMTLSFYLLIYITKDAEATKPVLFMAVLTGVVANVVRTEFESISRCVLANTMPTDHNDKLEARLGPVFAAEFRAELDKLKQFAAELELARKGPECW